MPESWTARPGTGRVRRMLARISLVMALPMAAVWLTAGPRRADADGLSFYLALTRRRRDRLGIGDPDEGERSAAEI